MTNERASNEIWDRLSQSKENIPCVVSANYVSGDGEIIEADAGGKVTIFTVKMAEGNTIQISCKGVEVYEKVENDN